LKVRKKNEGPELLDRIESVSNDIQLLALNIAVAAAKMAQKKDPGLEVHHKLSQLVNQATQTVKHMTRIINAAKTNNAPISVIADRQNTRVDQDLIENIEAAMQGIIADSEKITSLLSNLKQR